MPSAAQAFDSPRRHSTPIIPAAALEGLRTQVAGCDIYAAADWFRLRRDRYVPRALWQQLSDTERLLVMVEVVAHAAESARPISHCSAAAVWEIPVIGRIPAAVEVTVPDGRRGRSPGVIRHRSQNCPIGILHNGIRVTTPARTAVDLARLHSLACGVAAMDNVLHRGLATYAELNRELEAIPKGGRGRRRARLALALADGRSESAGESLSRVRLFELGYPRPDLQHRFFDHRGTFVARTDLFWEVEQMVGEFDGLLKYRVPEGADPQAAGRIVTEEKRREDAIRRLGVGVARWVWDEAFRPDRFQRVLTSYDLYPRADDSWLERF